MRHVIDLCHEGLYKPEIATLDCGSLNFGDGNRAYVSTPNYLRQGAAIARDLGVKPELEVFDTGNLSFVKQMIKEGFAHRAVAHSIVHGNSLWGPRRCRAFVGDGQCVARELQLGVHSPSAACKCPGSRNRSCWAAMCASDSKTICT